MMLQSQQNALYWTQRAEPHNCEHGGLYRATLGKNDMRKLTDSWNHSARQLCIDPLSRQVFIYGELLPYDGAIWRCSLDGAGLVRLVLGAGYGGIAVAYVPADEQAIARKP